jgi:hypothetical protein
MFLHSAYFCAVLICRLCEGVNNINDQLDATITILLIFESAEHISGNLLPIFRSVRLWFTTMWCIVLML